MKSGQQFARGDAPRLRPRIRIRLVQIFDRERLVVERLRELERREPQPMPRVLSYFCAAYLAPTTILLHLAGHDGTAITPVQGLEASGLGDGADGQVPAAVGRDQGATVQTRAVAQ